jgi:phage shock protein E
MILIGLTAVLALWFLWTHPPPRGLDAPAAVAQLKAGNIHTVIDVRSSAEWTNGHYPHAIHVPLTTLQKELPRKIPDRDTPLLFYCRTGRRAAEATQLAQELGYTQLWYLNNTDYTGLESKHNILTV